MAKRNNRVRSSVVGDPEEINRVLDQEFNPVKEENLVTPSHEGVKTVKQLLESFAEYYYSNNRSVQPLGLHIDSFLEQFNPVKIETEPEQPKVKTTAAFDNSRLEYLRMQIGPVQNFYQTLGNILFSLSMRLDVAEGRLYTAELKNKMYDEYAVLIATEGRIVSMDEFKIHWEKLQKEKGNETKTDKE